MALRVSTISTDVFIHDLGIVLVHPTLNKDLEVQFSSLDIRNSKDLTSLVQSNLVIIDDGVNRIYADDYDPDFLTKRELGLKEDSSFISLDEIISTGQKLISPLVFPLSLNSTANITKNIYAPGGRFVTWGVSVDDKIVISGAGAGSGIYTVAAVLDHQNLTTIENINDSTGGIISIYHPPGATIVGVNSSTLSYSSAPTLQGVLEDLNNTSAGSLVLSTTFSVFISSGHDHKEGTVSNLSSFNRILGYNIKEIGLPVSSGMNYSLRVKDVRLSGFDYVVEVTGDEWWPGPSSIELEVNLTWE